MDLRSESEEINLLLENALKEKDEKKLRAVMKRVVADQTIGLQIEGSFPHVVKVSNLTNIFCKNFDEYSDLIFLKCVNTRDLVLKKLVYFYLQHNAKNNEVFCFFSKN